MLNVIQKDYYINQHELFSDIRYKIPKAEFHYPISIGFIFIIISFLNVTFANNIAFYEFKIMRNVSATYPLTAHGLLCTDKAGQSRIVIYWHQPEKHLLTTDFLTCSEFLFLKDEIYVWWNQGTKSKTWKSSLPLSQAPLLNITTQTSIEIYLKAITNSILLPEFHASLPKTELSYLFNESEHLKTFHHLVLPDIWFLKQKNANLLGDYRRISDFPLLGRKYSKWTGKDGTVEWLMRKALIDNDMARIVIKPLQREFWPNPIEAFCPQSLGRWIWAPNIYRRYWEFKKSYININRSNSVSCSNFRAIELYKSIDKYTTASLPNHILHAWYSLRYKVAILTGEEVRICRAANDYFRTILKTEQPIRDTIVDVGRITKDAWPVLTESQIKIFVKPMVMVLCKSPLCRNPYYIEELKKLFVFKKWYWFGNLFVNSIRENGMATLKLNEMSKELDQHFLAHHITDPLPHELAGTVASFIDNLHARPDPGQITSEDLHRLLEKCFDKPLCGQTENESSKEVSRVLNAVKILGGNGPWQGNAKKLYEAILDFDKCLEPYVPSSQRYTTLAVVIALSFYDTSSSEDHILLGDQLSNLFREIQSILVRQIDTNTGKGTNIYHVMNDLQKQFLNNCQRYIDDPLWPMFKYPLSRNEITRLKNTMLLLLTEQQRYHHQFKANQTPENKNAAKEHTERCIQRIAHIMLYEFLQLRASYSGVTSKYLDGTMIFHVNKHILENPQRARQTLLQLKSLYLGHRLNRSISSRKLQL